MSVDHWFPADRKFVEALAAAKMPFGKYQGQLLISIPIEYRTWLEQSNIAKGPLQKYLAVINELERQQRTDILTALHKMTATPLE